MMLGQGRIRIESLPRLSPTHHVDNFDAGTAAAIAAIIVRPVRGSDTDPYRENIDLTAKLARPALQRAYPRAASSPRPCTAQRGLTALGADRMKSPGSLKSFARLRRS